MPSSHECPQTAKHPHQDQDLDAHNLHTRNFHTHNLHTRNLHSQDQDLELRAPIQEAADLWIEALRANPVMWDQTVRGLRKGLKNLSTLRKTISVGSICSGSEVLQKVLLVFEVIFNIEFNVDVTFRHRYACEKCPKKRDHILQNCSVDLLFKDMYPLTRN